MAIPAILSPVIGYVAKNKAQALIGSSIGAAIVALFDKIFGEKKKELDKKIDKINNENNQNEPNQPQNPANKANLLSLISAQNEIMALQIQVLNSLASAISLGSLGKVLDSPELLNSFIFAMSADKANDKEAKKAKNPSQRAVQETDTTTEQTLAKTSESELATIAAAIAKLNESQLANNELTSAMIANSTNNAQRLAGAITSGKLKAEVKNNVKVANEVIIRRLEAELAVNKPVEVVMPAEILAHNKSMLEQKTKEVENSTKTLEIYKEQDTFAKTAQNITDLDGNSIINVAPRELALQYQATRARTATDENTFELSDSDIDSVLPNLPDISKIFDFKLPHQIDKEYLNNG